MVKTIAKNNKKSRRAVSPIVAVLILIVVAVVGGGAVAVLMGQIGSDTSKQASVGNTQQRAAQTLNIGGSSVLFPLDEALAPGFTQQTGIKINDAQGGSGAGIIGVDQGALDIGVTSNLKTYQDAAKAHPLDDLRAFEFGGAAVVPIVHGSGAHGFSVAGGNECVYFPQSILKTIYSDTVNSLFTLSCAADGTVTAAAGHAAPVVAGDIRVYQRGDNSGAGTTWAAYVFQDPNKKDVHNSAAIQLPSNQAIVAEIQNANPSIVAEFAYTDVGSATTNGKVLTGIAIASTGIGAGAPPNPTTVTPPVGTGDSIKATNNVYQGITYSKSLDGQIKAALQAGTSGSLQFPGDNTNPNAQLTQNFYYVTKGAPSATDEQWLDYARSTDTNSQGTGVVDIFHSLGFYSYSEFAG